MTFMYKVNLNGTVYSAYKVENIEVLGKDFIRIGDQSLKLVEDPAISMSEVDDILNVMHNYATNVLNYHHAELLNLTTILNKGKERAIALKLKRNEKGS